MKNAIKATRSDEREVKSRTRRAEPKELKQRKVRVGGERKKMRRDAWDAGAGGRDSEEAAGQRARKPQRKK